MRSSFAGITILTVLLLAACPRGVPDSMQDVRAVSVDAGSSEEQALAAQVERIDSEAAVVVRAMDEALWQHWVADAPLDLAKATVGHEQLLSKPTIEVLRRAQLANVEPIRARHLESWVVGAMLAHALTAETEAVASLEAAATFSLDGKEIAWRDLPRLLVIERSAVKRRALWSASAAAAGRLEVLHAHRDAVEKETLASLEVPSALDFEAQTREVNVEALAAQARNLLEATDPLWKETLKSAADAELKLPLEAVTRADVPRLLKTAPAVDAAFPKGSVPTFALATLADMGLSGAAGLTFDLSDGPKKKPLPLTVAPSASDVRVSYKPAGGMRDLVQLLGEVGAAVALRSAKTGHISTDRLGDPGRALTLSQLFIGLAADPAWLTARGIAEPLQPAIIAAAKAHRLYVLRRACLVLLLRYETANLSEAEARARFVELAGRVYMVKVPADEGVRFRLELDDSLRSASTVKAFELAALERSTLPADWWRKPETVTQLLAKWASGTAHPRWTQAEQDQGYAALLHSFSVEDPAVAHAPAVWPRPTEVATEADAGSTAP